MGRLTTHVLDAAHGCPGSSIKIELYRVEGSQLHLVANAQTNSDGRCDAPLLQGDDYRSGVYQLQFHAGDYYRARGVQLPEPAFLDVVVLRFGISAEQEHYHVPLLISPLRLFNLSRQLIPGATALSWKRLRIALLWFSPAHTAGFFLRRIYSLE